MSSAATTVLPPAAPVTESVPEPSPTPVAELAARAKAASRAMAAASTAVKDAALHAAADLLVTRADQICAANAIDVERAIAGGTPAPLVDRLRL
ncbi:MAG: gamma-glutamyl-phosphate reductase, partial [Acidimicrobiaceae bacterium]|nr:gamma-glutamyl-phosphate reductase [Acidimicrobiaceae bacterium]